MGGGGVKSDPKVPQKWGATGYACGATARKNVPTPGSDVLRSSQTKYSAQGT